MAVFYEMSKSQEEVAVSPEDDARNAPEGFNPWRDVPFIYRLQVGDKIEVRHASAKELNKVVTILPDGRIYLPLINGVLAEDMSPDDLARKLEQNYQDDLLNPRITVIPTEIGSQKVFVGGEVLEPGVYDFDGPFGVVEALFSAGGLVNSSNDEEVVIVRRTPDDRAMVRVVDVAAVLDRREVGKNLRLRQYDIVFVPKTRAAEIGVWVEQNITNILPFSRSFSYSLNRDLQP